MALERTRSTPTSKNNVEESSFQTGKHVNPIFHVRLCGNWTCDLCALIGLVWLWCLRATHSLTPFGEHWCTVGIHRDPPVWPSTQAEWWRLPERQLFARKIGCPLSRKSSVTISAELVVPQTVWLVGVRSIPFFFCSWSEECPGRNRFAYASTSREIVTHRHEDDSMSEFFRSDPASCHLLLDLTKQLQYRVSWEIFPLELDWFSVGSFQFTIFRRIHEPSNVSFPVLYRLKMFMNSAKTKQSKRVPLLSTG